MESIQQTIARLRRTQPRNADTMRVCDECERMINARPANGSTEAFDRKAYMRQYMKDRRARERAERERTR